MIKSNELSIQEYRKFVDSKSTKAPTLLDDNIQMLLSMNSELTALTDIFKTNLLTGKPVDWANIKEECGDLFFCFIGFLNVNGLSLKEIVERNIEKINNANVKENLAEERIALD
jgi:NTP pyrophosphatase (non-canonical NTP hydrolase)